ncbi:MAG: cytochrome P450, partial [Nevskiales bacterium]
MTTVTETANLKQPPHVREWPLIGSLPGMMTDPARYFYDCYRKYGPAYRMNLLGQEYTVLAGEPAVSFMSSRVGKDC